MADNKPPVLKDDDNNNNPQRPEPPTQPPFGRGVISWLMLAVLIMLLLSVFMKDSSIMGEKISADEFWTRVQNGYVESLELRKDSITGQMRSDTPGLKQDESLKFTLEYPVISDQQGFINRLESSPSHIDYDYNFDPTITEVILSLLPWLLFGVLIYFFLFRQLRNAGAGGGILGNFGRSRHRVGHKEDSHTTFDDVAGIQEAKDEVSEIVEFLRNPKKFRRLGARISRGVLLVGEPGCGKTLLAKAIAGEAEVPFFSISGSDFVEMFVGVGASRVRDLFKQAKESSPCIIFLDEIDAVGRRRGTGYSGGGHDEREQTLNAILVEMDGFESNDQVIVIAATNRVDVLDPALTRPGRFDREIHVPLPDIKGRMEILKIYVDRIRCGDDVDLQLMARGTPMFSGADLAALVNEAAISATLAGKDRVEHVDLEEARDKVRWGRARKSHVIDEREREMTACHEAGHALIQLLVEGADPLHKVSIIPRGDYGGATFSLPEKDRHMHTRKWCMAFICIAMAGRIAEEMYYEDLDSGAASDIANATQLARKMVMDWGMSSELGFIRYNPAASAMGELPTRDYSERTAEVIDGEILKIMTKCETKTRKLLEDNKEKLQAVTDALLKYETLGAEEVKTIVAGGTIDKPTVEDLLASERTDKSEKQENTEPEK